MATDIDDIRVPLKKKAKIERPLNIYEQIVEIELQHCAELNKINFGKSVTYIYNPLEYASEPHQDFVRKYGNGKKKILFLGMNPGPFGMAQNGVPFGDPKMVRDWLKVAGTVGKPPLEHPKRPIYGLQLSRSEVSGSRFWGFFQDLCGDPETFFRNCYVANYCPMCFMTDSGKNITPPSLKAEIRQKLEAACDQALLRMVAVLGVEWIIGVGQYAEARAKAALAKDAAAASPPETRGQVKVGAVMHPSPINPTANKNWTGTVSSQLTSLGLLDTVKGASL